MAIIGIIAVKVFLQVPTPTYPIASKIAYSFTLRNLSAKAIEKAELWVRAPVRKSAFQHCIRLNSSHSHQLQTDEAGNQLLVFSFANLPPHAAKIIFIKADMLFSTIGNAMAEENPDVFLAAQKQIESDHPEIMRLAARLKTKTPLGTVKNIHAWISANILAEEYSRRIRGAALTMERRKGDCSEFAALFTALCRAAKIPARMLEGFRTGSSGILTAANLHNWAEFYLDRRWHIADPFENNFMTDAHAYLATHIIADTPAQGPLAFHCFGTRGEGLWVKMNQ